MSQREGYLKAAKRILDYFKTFPKERIIVDTTYPDHSIYPIEERPNWKDFYPDTEEEILNNLPKSKGPKVRMTVYVDADHAHDLVTSSSITDILLMLNNTPTMKKYHFKINSRGLKSPNQLGNEYNPEPDIVK